MREREERNLQRFEGGFKGNLTGKRKELGWGKGG